jgi:hypothetical protein
MKNTINGLLCLLVFCFITGCSAFQKSNKYMAVKEPTRIHTPDSGRALIIFERVNSRVGEFNSVTLWDITDRNADPINFAILHPTMKSGYIVDPGEHFFMTVIFGRHEILKANVSADKTYFVLLQPEVYFWKRASMKLIPIRKGSENPVTANNISEMLPAGANWAKGNIASATRHMNESYTMWDQMSDSDKSKYTLNANDGR